MLQASPGRVWEVLTDPALTRRYMNDCSVSSDWQVGSAIHWKDNNDQPRYKGNILEYEAGRKITYTYFDPHSGDEDQPSSYVHVCYLVVPRNGVTELLVTLTNFGGDDTRAEHAAENWDFEVLPKLKSLAEERVMAVVH
jgi:uncharacterized protein YndB with AHSA1/START domain